MILGPAGLHNTGQCIPRESGDDPALERAVKTAAQYSPRERG